MSHVSTIGSICRISTGSVGGSPSSGPPPFSPSDIAGLELWLDASDASTITVDGSNNVSQWNDKSGNSKNATQTTSSLRPLSETNGVRFANQNNNTAGGGDIANEWMSIPATTIRSVFAVVELDSVGSSPADVHGLISSDNSGNALYTFIVRNSSAQINYAVSVDGNLPGTVAGEVFINGVSVGTGENPGSFSDVVQDQIASYGVIYSAAQSRQMTVIAANRNSTTETRLGLDGIIHELLVYSTVPSTEELASLNAYLNSRWGISV